MGRVKEGVPLFTYGTLRVGEHNFYMVADILIDEPDLNCTARGHLWFSYPDSYPVAKFTRTEDTISGDILWLDDTDTRYQEMVRMEERAGYELRSIYVTLESGEQIDAYGFHYLRKPDAKLFIRGGDWRKAATWSSVNDPH